MSQEFCRKDLNLWRTNTQFGKMNNEKEDKNESKIYVDNNIGIFPQPINYNFSIEDEHDPESLKIRRTLSLFQTLGTFVAKSIIDQRNINISFNAVFVTLIIYESTLMDIQTVQVIH